MGVVRASGGGGTLYVGVIRMAENALGRWRGIFCSVPFLCFRESGAHGVYCVLQLAACDVTPKGGAGGDDNCVGVEECVLCGVKFGENFHPLAVDLCEGVCEFLYV